MFFNRKNIPIRLAINNRSPTLKSTGIFPEPITFPVNLLDSKSIPKMKDATKVILKIVCSRLPPLGIFFSSCSFLDL